MLSQVPLKKRWFDVPKDAARVVQELRGDVPCPTLDLSSPQAVSLLLFSTPPTGLALVPPPGAHKKKNGSFSTADAVRANLEPFMTLRDTSVT